MFLSCEHIRAGELQVNESHLMLSVKDKYCWSLKQKLLIVADFTAGFGNVSISLSKLTVWLMAMQ